MSENLEFVDTVSDLDIQIQAVNDDADFAAFIDAEDARRNADDATWLDDSMRCAPEAFVIPFDTDDAVVEPKPVTVRSEPQYADVTDNETDALGQIDPGDADAFAAFQVGRLTRPLRVDESGRVFSPLKFTCGGEAEALGNLIAEFNASVAAPAEPAGRIERADTVAA